MFTSYMEIPQMIMLPAKGLARNIYAEDSSVLGYGAVLLNQRFPTS
jgi:hypothetical protein